MTSIPSFLSINNIFKTTSTAYIFPTSCLFVSFIILFTFPPVWELTTIITYFQHKHEFHKKKEGNILIKNLHILRTTPKFIKSLHGIFVKGKSSIKFLVYKFSHFILLLWGRSRNNMINKLYVIKNCDKKNLGI